MTADSRPSLQTELLLTVGLLALAAVAAVAVASRYGTRLEFRRFQDVERRAFAERVDTLATALAGQLDARCCARRRARRRARTAQPGPGAARDRR